LSSVVAFASVLLLTSLAAAHANAQSAAASQAQASVVPARITQAIDETQSVRLQGNVHPLARPEFDQGAVEDWQPMSRMLMVLQRSPQQQAALQKLMDEQLTKDSPNYHRWLTPQQFGAQFGPADADIQAVTDWLTHQGFQEIKVAAGRTVVEFSGNVGQVRNAFHTQIHRFLVNGEMRQANAADPQIPAALAPVVAGIVTLHNFPRKSMRRHAGTFTGLKPSVAKPLFTTTSSCGSGGAQPCYIVGPADFAKIYNIPTSTLNGNGVTIAIVGDSGINPQDVTDFRTLYGLSGGTLTVTVNGPDPGIGGPNSDEGEADLDVQVAGMVAPQANINLVVSEDTTTANGIDLSALYIVDNNSAPVMSESFGVCEAGLGTAGNQFYNALWEQAAGQGISVMVSAGDNGSAGCDDFTTEKVAVGGLAVSGIASTPFNVAVGGTDFDDVGNQVTGGFWSSSNLPGKESAMGYIHEVPWNDSCAATATSSTLNTVCVNPTPSTLLNIAAGSGGPSNCSTSTVSGTTITCTGKYAKPSWQSALTPNDGARDLPDVSLFASDGPQSDSFYLFCEADAVTSGSSPSCASSGSFTFEGAGGTSASSPAFAGIMALIVQQQGGEPAGRQGNPNPVLYKIAQSETFSSCNSSTMPLTGSPACAFYDVTKGNNSVPCAGASTKTCSSQTTGTNGVLVTASGSTTPAWNAGPGYDLATGLGSVNVTNLAAAWTAAVGTFKATNTSLMLNAATTQLTITHGTSVQIAITVTSTTTGTPTGDVSLLAPTSTNGGLGEATLSAGSTSGFTTTTLPGGSYSVTARYAGDGTFAPSTSNSVPVVVNKENSKLQIGVLTFDSNGNVTSNPFATTFAYGSNYILRMDILKSSGTCLPFTTGVITGCALDATGTITVNDGTSPLDAGTFPVNSLGHAEDQPIQLAPGTHNLSATYPGDNSYNAPASASTATLTVTQAATQTTVTSSVSSLPHGGGSVTLTATVATNSNGAGPTGTVQFKNGGTALGTAVTCTPTAATSSAAAFCTATLTTTLSFFAPPEAPTRLPNLRTQPLMITALVLLMVLLLSLRYMPVASRRKYAFAGLLLIAGLLAGFTGCSNSNGSGGGHTDNITAAYSGDANYSSSTSAAVPISVQ